MAIVVRALEIRMSEAPGSTRFDPIPLSSEEQNRFVAENMRRVFLLIYRMVGNVADAQDLTQEAFIKALQRQDQLKDLEKAAHWLSRIASNTAIDFLRRSGRVSFSEIEELPEAVFRSGLESPEQRVLRTERKERLDAGLQILTDRERTALLLRDVEDLPAEEVAARLQCSKATVRSHIANARGQITPLSREEASVNHASEFALALHASGDLPLWQSLRVRLHVSGGEACRNLVAAYRADTVWAQASDQIPEGLNRDRLSAVITAIIRVGIAAGEMRRPSWP